jgi:DNA-binding NarL/FixJ family response regulator
MALRRMRRRLSASLIPEELHQDHTSDPFYVLINRDHSIQSVSSNTPNGPGLAAVLQALCATHRQSSPPTPWVAWIPGYMVEFQSMEHRTTTTLATLTPVGRATIPQLAQLTPAQVQIVRYAANGSTAPEIARSLNRSIETVRTHLRAAYRGLHVCSRIELLPSADEFSQWGAV